MNIEYIYEEGYENECKPYVTLLKETPKNLQIFPRLEKLDKLIGSNTEDFQKFIKNLKKFYFENDFGRRYKDKPLYTKKKFIIEGEEYLYNLEIIFNNQINIKIFNFFGLNKHYEFSEKIYNIEDELVLAFIKYIKFDAHFYRDSFTKLFLSEHAMSFDIDKYKGKVFIKLDL